jgi:alkylation response protein AidB-like acyl-CoA dehydrogenase
MLLMERGPGFRTKPIKTSYSSCAGTAYVIMENVKVPVEHLIGAFSGIFAFFFYLIISVGTENQGFPVIMFNFNHERWLIVCQSIRMTRLVVEECFKWAVIRKAFGKPLAAQPVIRHKLAMMVAQVEGVQNWLDNITHQMNKMSYKEQSVKLAGPIALLKLYATKVGTAVSDESCQIFGGRAITQTGMGQVIERYHRATKFAAILGGSEEIMADLGIKQAIKQFPKTARL